MSDRVGPGTVAGDVLVPRREAFTPPVAAYVVVPDGAVPAPGLLLLDELCTLSPQTRRLANRLARAGYAVLALDLTAGRRLPGALLRLFDGAVLRPFRGDALADLGAASAFLRGQRGVDARRIGVLGLGIGGSYALQLACDPGCVRAAAVFFAQNPRPLAVLAGACPIVGSYPERDGTARAGRALQAHLEQCRVPHDVRIYEGARRGFLEEGGGSHDPTAAADAWARTLAFLDAHLRAAAPGPRR